MENKKKISLKALIVVIVAALLVIGGTVAAVLLLSGGEKKINEVPATDQYGYVNPDETKADTDEGFKIDGVLDEAAYKNNQWLYLHNDDGGNNVDIAMTSYYGEKGMYFVYDVTETVPIYVNLQRASYMNSCIEMYFAPSSVTSLKENSYFEVDMMPTGDMVFKKSNGKGGYVNVATTDDIMAHLGATTKGGQVNTDSCYGYCLELFIPWDYMTWLGLDAEAMKNSFVYVDPAHITSNNYEGTDTSVDRYWYFYAQQQGAGFSDVYQYFRFDGTGALGTVPVILEDSEHCTLSADPHVIPGMQTQIHVKPESGYALTSIVANGEELIEKVDFREDGSVVLVTRAATDGLTVSANAEAVSAGNKSLTGKVNLRKNGGDSLDGLQISYNGAEGEVFVELDGDGNFTLADMPQGHYMLTARKAGYTTLTRSIYLSRDMHVQLNVEYPTFYSERGTCWVLDGQNDGLLQKFGGTGYLLTTDSYNAFTFTSRFRYDASLTKEAETDFFQQQRSGMRILFSNGKYWHIDMLKENDQYIVQYAKHSGDGSVFGWKTLCVLNEDQVTKYLSDEGIKMTLMRDGEYAAVWLEDSLLAVEKLDDEFAGCTAQAGLEFWVANRTVQDIPYSIELGTSVNLKNARFLKENKWDVSGMFDSYITSPASTGDTGWMWTYDESYRDIALTVADKTPSANNFKMAVHFKFTNGEEFRISLTNADTGALGTYKIQVLDQNTIVKNWRTHYELNEEEIAKLKGDGLAFRVVIVDQRANVYLDNVQVCSLDLSVDQDGNATGIANATAQIGVRLYGNDGYETDIPYILGGKVNSASIQVSADSQVKVNGTSHVIGETVVLTPPDEGSEFVSVKVDGKEVSLSSKTEYSFTVTSQTHTVEAVSKRIRDWNPEENAGHIWDLTQQTSGLISHPGTAGDTGWVWTYDDCYRDISLTVSDKTPDNHDFRLGIHFAFTDGNALRVSLTNADEGALGTYKLQLMGANTILKNWSTAYVLTAEEAAKVTAEGIAFRTVILGESVNLYLDGKLVASYVLNGIGKSGAKVAVRFYGNNGAGTDVPYTLGTEPESFALNISRCENGTVTSMATYYLPGDTATVYVKGDSGYAYDALLVGGDSVTADYDGSYSFAADPTTEIRATFADAVFMDYSGNSWNVANQNKGFLFILGDSNGAGWMQTKDSFNELTLTVKDYAAGTVHEYAVVGQMFFENEKAVTIRFIYDKNSGKYNLQSMNDPIFKWKVHYTLNDEQAAKVQGEGIEFRMTRSGTKLNLYLDDTLVSRLDLTGNDSGITEEMTCVVKLRYYNSLGYDVILPFTVGNPLPSGNVTVETAVNGSVTADKTEYIIGETVTLTVKPDSGYAYETLLVNGDPVSVGIDGTYSFVANEDSYRVSGSFAEAVFVDFKDNAWNLIHQNQGVLYIPASSNGAGWMQTKANFNELTLTVKDYAGGTVHEYAVVGQLYFENGKYASIRLIYNKNNGKYTLQSMGDSVANWATHYTLTEAESAKVQGDGIQLKLSRVGTSLMLYLDGELVKTVDLTARNSGITATMTCVAKVRYYNNGGYDVALPFSLRNPGQEAAITVEAGNNGTVTADKNTCNIGDTVKLTVAPANGYACKELTVNGKTVPLGWDSTYAFTVTEGAYTVKATFDKVAFTRNSNNSWNFTNQLQGWLQVNSHTSGNSGWIDSVNNTNDVTMVVKDYTPDTKNFSMIYHFTFSNGETFRLRVNHTDSDGVYRIQSMSSSTLFAAWKSRHDFTAEETAKIKGEGIAFRVIILGTTAYVYLDDVQVCTYDLTSTGKGEDLANCTVKVALRMDGNLNTDVPIAYTLQETKELPQ